MLTPEDIGIYSAGFSIVALAHLFRDFGLNQYLIQERNLSRESIVTAFTLTLLISWSLGIVVYLSGGMAARFFGEEDIQGLVQLLSINFFIIPIGSITLALLRKALKFQITSSIAVIASACGVAVSIVTALDGARYFCLAYGAVTESAAMVLLSQLYRPKDARLGLSLYGAKKILKFGSIVGVGNIVHRLSISGSDALIAKFLGMSALGFYSRAFGTYSLFDQLFTSSISSTILPLFSRENDNITAMRNNYLKALSYSLIFAWPFFAILYLFTSEIMLVLYGPQWGEAVVLVKILCVAGFLVPPILFSDNLFIALGRPDITLKIRMVANLAKLGMVAIACQFSLKAVCIAIVIFFLLKLLLSISYLWSSLALRFKPLLKVFCQTLPCLILSIIPVVLADYWAAAWLEKNELLHISIIVCIAAIGWLSGLLLSKHPFTAELFAISSKLSGMRAK
ncbi:oligosaccharide flippase family protein [Parahaliea sp. F7430]|uniref:Oligosaccharide flippase family protein n=1 Tax=Sediminihaliea albiluteola TaxID=2758564 RepID=A0A7W2YJJ2_9GAMM|nr:oligosaccharide flippase family protein [Sediminihaliea albiluteola]